MYGVSFRRALAIVLTVVFYSVAVTMICLQILWPWTHDGALSPSQLAKRPFDPRNREYVWVAGTVTNCHTEPERAVVVYTLADEIGKGAARIDVEWRASTDATYGPGSRVQFSGERTAPTVVAGTSDLLRLPGN